MSTSNAQTAQAATQEDVLPSGFTLLGTTITATTQRALFRTGSGRVISREIGERVNGQTLTSVDMGEVTLSRGGSSKTMKVGE